MAEYKNIVGTGFPEEIQNQINTRQQKLNSLTRDSKTLQYLTNRNAWVRLSSGVNYNPNPAPIDISLDLPVPNPNSTTFRSPSDNLPDLNIDTTKLDAGYSNNLAKSNILQGGIISKNGPNTTLRGGFKETYTIGATDNLGFKPMPGITNVSITTGGKWQTLLQADIDFICYDLDQLDTMSKLYMSLGCTVFLEWGHTNYFKSDGTFEVNPKPIDFFNENNKEDLRKNSTKKVKNTEGNYESIVGTVYNFSYQANSDGSYSCKTVIMGAGGMVESLKINNSTNYNFDFYSKLEDKAEIFSSTLENALYTIKKFLSLSNSGPYSDAKSISQGTVEKYLVPIEFGETVLNKKTQKKDTYADLLNNIFQLPLYKGPEFTPSSMKSQNISATYGNPWSLLSGHQTEKDLTAIRRNFYKGYRSLTSYNGDYSNISDPSTYITLGHLLSLIQHLSIFTEGSGSNFKPVIYIDYNPDSTIIKRGIIEASIDPSKCLISYVTTESNQDIFYYPYNLNDSTTGVLWWKEKGSIEDNLLVEPKKSLNGVNNTLGDIGFGGKLFNILINLDFAINTLKDLSSKNEDKKVNLIEYIDTILNGINISLGKVNALRAFYDDNSNCIRIIDENYNKKEIKTEQVLILENFGTKSTVYDYSFTSKITPNLASQIVISAQALDAGGIKEFSEDVLSYQKLNGGVIDKFATTKKPSIPPQVSTNPHDGEQKSPLKKLFNHFYNVYTLANLQLDTINSLSTLYSDLQNKTEKIINPNNPTLLIPLEYSITLDGISGILPYSIFRVPDSRLPKRYRGKVDFVVFSINHSIENNKWYTTLRGQTLIRN